MFVFFGAVSHFTLLTMFATGAGLGAIGAFLRMDRAPALKILGQLG